MPSFEDTNEYDKPHYINEGNRAENREIHDLEMKAILKYSPFHNKSALFQQFANISGSSGTLVICYNLNLSDNGETEFDVASDPHDILIANSRIDLSDRKMQAEHHSFRSYVSILYSNPKMHIFIQEKKVQTKILERTLYFPIRYKHVSSKFKARDEKSKALADENLKKAHQIHREKSSVYNHFKNTYNKKSSQDNKELDLKRKAMHDAEAELNTCKLELERIDKNFNEPKSLSFVFGINVHNRASDGLFIYNCHRLILMHERPKTQSKSVDLRGLIGVVDVPRMVLEPMHNKQRFIDSKEEQMLIKEMGTHMESYVKELAKANKIQQSIDLSFWKNYGYPDMHFNYMPNDEESYKKARVMDTTTMVQCHKCLKWRFLPWHRNNAKEGFPSEEWECQDTTEVDRKSCKLPEFLPDIPLKTLIVPSASVVPASSSNGSSGSIFIVERSSNQIISRSVIEKRPSVEQQRAANGEKRRTNRPLSSENESDVSREDRQEDPDFRLNGNRQQRKRSKTSSSSNHASVSEVPARKNPTQPQSIFENHIIETDPTLPPIKMEPPSSQQYINHTDAFNSRQDKRTTDNDNYRQGSASVINNPVALNGRTSDIVNNYKEILKMMCNEINDHQQMTRLHGANDDELAGLDYGHFLTDFVNKCTAAKVQEERDKTKKEYKRKIRTRINQVLTKLYGHEAALVVVDSLFEKQPSK